MELINFLKNTFKPAQKVKPGAYSGICYTRQNLPYKLLLKVDEAGMGRLVVNASTILFLNQTSTEYIFHFIHGKYGEDVVGFMQSKYRAGKEEVLADYERLVDAIEALLTKEDVQPETQMEGFSIGTTQESSRIPLKLDCYLTLRRSASDLQVGEELELDQWNEIIDRSLNFGIPHFVLIGGEPLLRKDTEEIIAHAEKKGVVIGLVSGQEHLSDDLVSNLIGKGLDHLTVVVEEDAIADWELLRAIAEKDLFYKVVFQVSGRNYLKVVDALMECRSKGVQNVSFEMFEEMDQSQFDQLFDKVDEVGLTFIPFGEMTIHDGTGLDLERYATLAASNWQRWLVLPNGDVRRLFDGEWKHQGNLLTDPWETLSNP